VGNPPDTGDYIRRVVRQLDDIEFSENEDPEDVCNLRRQPRTVLTEEHLRAYVNEETGKINLENHYWISNNFISKLGRMAPQLQELSLRRMPQVTNNVFAEIFSTL
jgi:hypothetical protein